MDAQTMLVAAVAALWGIIIAGGRELRALVMRILDKCEDRNKMLEDAARLAVQAKDTQLSEQNKLILALYDELRSKEEPK